MLGFIQKHYDRAQKILYKNDYGFKIITVIIL